MTNGESEYKTVTLGERDIRVTLPTEGQFGLLTLHARNMRRVATNAEMAIASMGGFMAVVERIIHPDDREYVADELLEGNVNTSDLLGLLSVFGEEEASAKPARAVRRPAKR